MIDNWYGENCIIPTAANLRALKGQDAFPMRMLGHTRATGEIFGGPLLKATQIRKSGEMAMIYDGLSEHDYDANRISARHSKGKKCNMLFADGHAEAIDVSALPNGAVQSTGDLGSAAKLTKKPHPKWRLDQN
jgi:prepilin-type processing-associated H-X9-DG protein